MLLSQECEGFMVLLHLQVKKSSSQSLTGVGRRYETRGSETKDSLFLTAIAVARVSTYLHQFIKPQLHRVIWKVQCVALQERNSAHRELGSLIQSAACKPAICSGGQLYLLLPGC